MHVQVRWFCLLLSVSSLYLMSFCSTFLLCFDRSEKEELSDLKNYKIKAQNDRKKREILNSVYLE